MTKRVFGGFGAAVMGLSLLAWSVPIAAQSAADPWSRVPAFPTTCYSSDAFFDTVSKAIEALDADLARQTKINADIKAKFDALDMSEKMQRMQAFMMKDPQRAMQVMQAMTSAGATTAAAVPASAAIIVKMDQELKDHSAKLEAEIPRVLSPTRAAIKQLVDAKSLPAHGDAVIFGADADRARYEALHAQLNADYEKLCVEWWGATGAFQNWTRSYKTYLVEHVIAPGETMTAAVVTQMSIMDTPTGGYRSTVLLENVRKYMEKARTVYNQRPLGKFGNASAPRR